MCIHSSPLLLPQLLRLSPGIDPCKGVAPGIGFPPHLAPSLDWCLGLFVGVGGATPLSKFTRNERKSYYIRLVELVPE